MSGEYCWAPVLPLVSHLANSICCLRILRKWSRLHHCSLNTLSFNGATSLRYILLSARTSVIPTVVDVYLLLKFLRYASRDVGSQYCISTCPIMFCPRVWISMFVVLASSSCKWSWLHHCEWLYNFFIHPLAPRVSRFISSLLRAFHSCRRCCISPIDDAVRKTDVHGLLRSRTRIHKTVAFSRSLCTDCM